MTDTINTLEQKLQNGSFYFQDLIGSGLPTRKTEDWKYNDIFFLKNEHFQLLDNSSNQRARVDEIKKDIEKQSESLLNHNILLEPNRIIYIDGNHCESLSNIEDNEISFFQSNQITTEQNNKISSIEELYGEERNPLISLNKTTKNNLSYLNIDKNERIENPVYIIHYSTVAQPLNGNSSLSINKLVANIDKGSESSIVEIFLSQSGLERAHSQLATQTTLVNIEENTKLNHHRFNLEEKDHKQISNLTHLLNRNSNLNSFLYSHGSLLNKTDVKIINVGSGANSQTTGIYLPSKEQCIDYHTCIEHRVPHCNSKEIFRGIIADKAKATFNGKIHIFKDAQKSDAQLSNKNLLLTNTAEINTKPELEIYADDVICAHGATVAKIDDTSIFYLKSRGISEVKARAMISVGFINELLSYVKNESVKGMLAHLIQNKLSSF